MLNEVERLLVDALHADDPVARLRAGVVAAPHGALGDDERAWLLGVDEDGFRVASLLVRKLRFERALRGDPSARAEFDAAPAAFVERWRRYETSVPPAHDDPADEAAAWRAFRNAPPRDDGPRP